MMSKVVVLTLQVFTWNQSSSESVSVMLSKVKRVLYCSEEEEGEDVESRKLAKWCLNKVRLCVVPLLAGRQLFVFFGYVC